MGASERRQLGGCGGLSGMISGGYLCLCQYDGEYVVSSVAQVLVELLACVGINLGRPCKNYI